MLINYKGWKLTSELTRLVDTKFIKLIKVSTISKGTHWNRPPPDRIRWEEFMTPPKMYKLNLTMKKHQTIQKWVTLYKQLPYNVQKSWIHEKKILRNSFWLKEAKETWLEKNSWCSNESFCSKEHYLNTWQNLNRVWGLDGNNVSMIISWFSW